MYNVYDHVNTESIDGKGGFAETSILDNGRIGVWVRNGLVCG